MHIRKFTVAGALAIAGLYAQKPTGGTVTGEVSLNDAINNINIGLVQGARVRYFLGDNLAIRVGLGLDVRNRTNKDYENPDGTGGVGEERKATLTSSFCRAWNTTLQEERSFPPLLVLTFW